MMDSLNNFHLFQHGGGGRDGGRDGGRGGGSRYDDGGEDRTAGDWRSGPPAAPRGGDDRKDRYEPPRDRGELLLLLFVKILPKGMVRKSIYV
jgi:hypothetical protein